MVCRSIVCDIFSLFLSVIHMNWAPEDTKDEMSSVKISEEKAIQSSHLILVK